MESQANMEAELKMTCYKALIFEKVRRTEMTKDILTSSVWLSLVKPSSVLYIGVGCFFFSFLESSHSSLCSF